MRLLTNVRQKLTIKVMKGQTLLVIILVVTVALAIGLSVVQRSLTDISTSSKVEESARAFSAAEAGIERVLQSAPAGPTSFTLPLTETQASAQVTDTGLLPITSAGSTQVALEEDPPLSKEEVSHIWLADPASSSNTPSEYYNQDTLDIYWGEKNTSQKPALELKIVWHDGTNYQVLPFYWDSAPATRTTPNGFDDKSGNCSDDPARNTVNTTSGNNRPFYCKTTITGLSSNRRLILLRARILYSGDPQPFAVGPIGSCGQGCSLPRQVQILTSTGTAGETQRKVRVSKKIKVVPFYFDYAIFSAGDISK
ncbi:hypothetical protein HYS94_02565 [Candidatus Daviesbacteria bacterium]|nr:hypothetical protein [Candidatus Daviesbacteria bacterium]